MKCQQKFCRNKTPLHGKDCYKCRMRKYRQRNQVKAAYFHLKYSAWQRADRRGVPRDEFFKLTLFQFMVFNEETNYVNLKGRDKNSIHLDRIDHAKGYEVNNIQTLKSSINAQKGNSEKYYQAATGRMEDMPF